eukprot:Gb_18880 [translate_table: standard]
MTDDDFPTEMIEEHFESLLDPPEVQELMEEMGQAGVPLNSIISKAAEVHLYDVVDRLLLGNRWIRKVTGIQPKFPFMVHSFEERTAAAVSRARELSLGIRTELKEEVEGGGLDKNGEITSLFGPESKEREKPNEQIHSKSSQKSLRSDTAEERSNKSDHKKSALNGGPTEQNLKDQIMPIITMVGISQSDPYRVNKASMKKTMEALTREIEERNQRKNEFDEDKDPLFVANVGDFKDFASPSSVLEERESHV